MTKEEEARWWSWALRVNWSVVARKACVFVVNAALLIAGLFNLALGCIEAKSGDHANALTYLVAGLLLLLAASIDRFEVLKGFGLEAKTRELSKVLHEADATLETLRQLAVTTGDSIIQLFSSAGRSGAVPTIRESHRRAKDVRAFLGQVGTDEQKIREILRPWVRITVHHGSKHLIKAIRDALTQVQQENNREAMDISTPHTPADAARYAQLIARGNAAGDFNRDRVGNPWLWPAGATAPRLEELVRSMPVLDESVRDSLIKQVEPWLPRLRHLESRLDLLEPEVWYEIDPDT